MARAAGRRRRLPSNARAARPSRCLIRNASGSAAISAVRPALVPYEEIKEAFSPESLLPIKVSETQVRESIRRWYRQPVVRAEQAQTRRAHRHRQGPLHSVLDLRRAGPRGLDRRESGYYYYETETLHGRQRQDADAAGAKGPLAMSVSGSLDHFFDDELVPASRGVQPDLLRQGRTVSHHQGTRHPTTPGFSPAGSWSVTRLISWSAASMRAKVMDGKMYSLCAAQVPGDTHRNLHVNSDYSGQTFKHILVPVWLLDLQLRPAQFPGGHQRIHRRDRRPVSEELGEDPARRAGGIRCSPDCWR